jgi:hypothetical protein
MSSRTRKEKWGEAKLLEAIRRILRPSNNKGAEEAEREAKEACLAALQADMHIKASKKAAKEGKIALASQEAQLAKMLLQKGYSGAGIIGSLDVHYDSKVEGEWEVEWGAVNIMSTNEVRSGDCISTIVAGSRFKVVAKTESGMLQIKWQDDVGDIIEGWIPRESNLRKINRKGGAK